VEYNAGNQATDSIDGLTISIADRFLRMQLKIKTKVQAAFEEVVMGFDRNLFEKLNPPFPPVRVCRFDGSQTGDRVVLELNFIFFKQEWESSITFHTRTADSYEFHDEGIRLPFFLSKWKHRHRIEKAGNNTRIIDDISFRASPTWLTWLLWPLLAGQFVYRVPVYKKYFRSKSVRLRT